MKNFVIIFLFQFLTTILAFGQNLIPVGPNYLFKQESLNTHGKKSLKDAYSLIQYDTVYYKTDNTVLITDSHFIYPLSRAYQSINNYQPFYFKSQTDYILFQNKITGDFDRVIDLKNILKDGEIKQIWHTPRMSSISISNDNKYLFFATATNTFIYNLENNRYAEIVVKGRNVTLSPVNGILTNNNIVLMIMDKVNKFDWTPNKNFYVEFNYQTKQYIIKS